MQLGRVGLSADVPYCRTAQAVGDIQDERLESGEKRISSRTLLASLCFEILRRLPTSWPIPSVEAVVFCSHEYPVNI